MQKGFEQVLFRITLEVGDVVPSILEVVEPPRVEVVSVDILYSNENDSLVGFTRLGESALPAIGVVFVAHPLVGFLVVEFPVIAVGEGFEPRDRDGFLDNFLTSLTAKNVLLDYLANFHPR